MRPFGGLFLLGLMLTGCTVIPVPAPDTTAEQNWQRRSQNLASLLNWELTGRLAIKTDEKAMSGTLHWKQQTENYSIRLIGPFGKGTVNLTGDQARVVLTTSKGDSYYASSPDQIIYQELGLKLPLSKLHYWVLGRPAPGAAPDHISYDPKGRITTLQQDDWQVSYRSYHSQYHPALPKKIFINNHKLSVRLVIDQWSLPLNEY